jgi:hypothetical protein
MNDVPVFTITGLIAFSGLLHLNMNRLMPNLIFTKVNKFIINELQLVFHCFKIKHYYKIKAILIRIFALN